MRHEKAIEAALDALPISIRIVMSTEDLVMAIAAFLRAETDGHRNCYCRMCVTADELEGKL